MILSPVEVKKIGVFRALQLGDMLTVIPAIRALRFGYPDAEIILLGMPWEESFVKRFSQYFDRFIHFPGYSGLPEQVFDEALYQAFLKQMQDEQFDLLLQMQGNGTIVNNMMKTWGAKHLAGFQNQESYTASPLFMEYLGYGSEVHRHMALMSHLGLPSQGDDIEFPVTEKDEKEYEDAGFILEPKSYVCVHPGSRGAWRQWPPENFAKLADECAHNGLTVVVTGTKEEQAITANVINNMKYDAIDATNKTSLGAMALLIKNAFCLIANCTGVSHIASAVKTPSVVISMDGEPERWSPLHKDIHLVTDWTKQPDFALPFRDLQSLLVRRKKLIKELNWNPTGERKF